MKVVIVGLGAVGARAARQVMVPGATTDVVVVDTDHRRAEAVAASLGPRVSVESWGPPVLASTELVVLALPAGHPAMAAAALQAGADVVSVADDVAGVEGLLALDEEARRRRRTVVVGAGFAPGLSCLLVKHAAAGFDLVEEVHVAKAGTGGPGCALHHHRALGGDAPSWRNGAWATRRGGSGRELVWFPDPLGARDCYQAAAPDALVLVPAFPGVARVTVRVAASRRDRLTAQLPMVRRPHAEGTLGGLRVEVRGRRGLGTEVRVLGALDPPAMAAGVVAGVAADWMARGLFVRSGAGGLAEMVEDPLPFLQELAHRGVRAAAFGGAEHDAGATPPV
ncbi:MAG TPA: Gfo/Idh/MocA family oxidoreductase [Acidimicrobiales bacterium]|nr:Gfo/Idh/MocA family oxidoreductase [Acidimicrobiales bacterium]